MDLVIVDIETTGLDPEKDEVIELCALRVRWPDFEIVDSMYRRSSPFGEVTPEAAACNGYTPGAWAGYVCGWQSHDLGRFAEVVRGAQWVGSAPQFDFNFLDKLRRDRKLEPFALRSRRLVDVGTLGLPLLLALSPESKGGQDAILDVLRDSGRPVPSERPQEFAFSIGSPDRWQRHTAIGDAFGALHILETLLPPAVAHWRSP